MFHWLLIHFFGLQQAWARGGGGGSHSGGGGSHGGGSFSGGVYSSSGSGGSPDWGVLTFFFIVFLIWLFIALIVSHRNQKKSQGPAADFSDDPQKSRIAEVFYAFQEAWSSMQVEKMKDYLSDDYYKRIVLELNVLQALGRQDVMNNPRLQAITILTAAENQSTSFTAQLTACADDTLIDTASQKVLFKDSSQFTEYWDFIQVDSVWKLNLIKQQTEAAVMLFPEIRQFAETNGFFYDPDSGWLMLPSKGAIFNNSNFQTSDVNNHVIGYYQEKIVEFYTFNPIAQRSLEEAAYVVAQVVLPSTYRDILVTTKGFWQRPPRGMVMRTLESPEFNARFSLFADPLDQYSSWRLLSPTFMEKLSSLNFAINIEVIGNFLYFYTKDAQVEYAQLLEILTWAFDELKS